MKTQSLSWKVGYTKDTSLAPEERFEAVVPGAVQLDYARAHGWPDWTQGVNFRDYHWMDAVSYTHLDVYKRQVFCRTSWKPFDGRRTAPHPSCASRPF